MYTINFNGWEISIESNILRPISNDHELVILNNTSETALHIIANEYERIEILKVSDSTKFEITSDKTINIYAKYENFSELLNEDFIEPTATNFSDIFVFDPDNTFEGLSNIDKVEHLINSSTAPLCDACLSNSLKITPVNQINQICNKLLKKEKIFRTKEICPVCGVYRKVSRKK